MASVIDADFRSAMSPPTSGKAAVRSASSESGDDFATRLKQVREEAAGDAAAPPADALISATLQSPLSTPDWPGASAPADPAVASEIAAPPAELGKSDLLDAAWIQPQATPEPVLTLPPATAAAAPSSFSLLTTAAAEPPTLKAPGVVSQATVASTSADPIPVPATSGAVPEISELATDRELVKADVQAAEAGTAIPGAGQPANPTSQTATSGPSPAIAPSPDAKVAEAEQHIDAAKAPLPEGTAQITGDAAAAVAAVGVIAAPTAQTSASGEKPASNLVIAAPKANAKLAAIANAEGNNPAPPSPATAILSDQASASAASLSEVAGFDAGGSSAQGTSVLTFAAVAPGASQPSAALTTVPAAPFTSPTPVLVAVPAEVVNIVSKTAEDGQSDRVVVQLDPPELGRVSIDFKFDAQGVQHVIITSETPEAMRQLRQMHGELVQALERQGIGNQNMTFQHQQQSQQQSPQANPLLRMAAAGTSTPGPSLLTAIQPQPSSPQLSAGGRLDIRL